MQNNFLSPILFVLVVVLVLLSIVAIFYLYITAKNRERLALIEKGMDPNLARSDFWPQVGIIGGGIAAGLIAGDVTGLNYGPLLAMLFAGAGLVTYHVIRRSRMQRNRM
jgi:hypothetical protein